MRIIPPLDDESWRVILTSRHEPLCLEDLALRCGYRVCEICDLLHCSSRYLHAVFLRDAGLPPKQWLRRERMKKALSWLDRGMLSAEIAEKLGFSNPGNFKRERRLQQSARSTLGDWPGPKPNG